jgi:hypothetical protein
VSWRERVATEKVARFARDTYWGRPLPGFGDPNARVFVLGLAPAAHGGNRTGRIFTGDRSGDVLCAALYATGFANQPTSVRVDDGLILSDAYLAAVRCAPPMNRPTIVERDNCSRTWFENSPPWRRFASSSLSEPSVGTRQFERSGREMCLQLLDGAPSSDMERRRSSGHTI